MSWLLTNDTYEQACNKHVEGAFTQGNGYLNIRASFDEDLSDATQNDVYWRLPANVTLEKQRHKLSKWGVYIPGIYGNHPILREEIVNLPYPLGVNLNWRGEHLDMNTSSYTDFRRTLNMRNGVFKRELQWSVDGCTMEVSFERYCSMAVKNMVIQMVELTPDRDGEIIVSSFIETDVTTNGYNHFVNRELDVANSAVYVMTDSNQHVGMINKVIVHQGQVKADVKSESGKRIQRDMTMQLVAGEKVVIEKRTYFGASIDTGYVGDIKKHLQQVSTGCEEEHLFAKHQKIWEEKWNQSDVIVEGNEAISEAVRFSIYHLLRSVNDKDTVAIDAKAYAGEAYFGHYFWDTEVYLLPFFIYTQPEYAKKLIRYRYQTLQGAKHNAKTYGYQGAKYSWESCMSGEEQCSNWQYADLEAHVTADVIFGLIHYCANTEDRDFLIHEGLEMMVETARYWMERTYKTDGKYHIRGVMGPDEYLAFTDNNTFTNYMVRYTLEATLDAIILAKEEKSSALDGLAVTEQEIETIRDMAVHMVMLIDEDREFIWQCEEFEDFETVDIDKIWLDRSRPFGQFISQERNYRSKVLKQADVVALLYLFRKNFSDKMKQNCIDYYEPITTHDSSLSYIFHALVYSDLGDAEKAYDMFYKSIGIDLDEKGAAEGIHIANCGGIWQALVMGFAGVSNSLEGDEFEVKPRLPEGISGLKFKVYFKGDWYEVDARRDGVVVDKIEG